MQLACPNCGTRDVRASQLLGPVRYLKHLFGVSALRCRCCDTRWETSVWANGSWKYARCPRCYRQELTKWRMQYRLATRWTRFLLRIGASPRRCPACRCNFATFKPARGNFEWRHQVRAQPVPRTRSHAAAGQGAAFVAEQTPPGEESGNQMP
jgi:hypothetical protein